MDLCPGCNFPVSTQERLTGRCAKDGQPLMAARSEVVIEFEEASE